MSAPNDLSSSDARPGFRYLDRELQGHVGADDIVKACNFDDLDSKPWQKQALLLRKKLVYFLVLLVVVKVFALLIFLAGF